MRYSERGGLTPQARADREAQRMQAATLSADGVPPPQVARLIG
jgi:hypothetical protein